MSIIYQTIPSPAFVLEEALLRKNLELIAGVQRDAGVEIILALKGFSMWSVFPFVKKYLSGATASSLNEARLIFEEMGCKAHTYCVAYLPDEFEEIMRYSSHLVFNSVAQYERFRSAVSVHNTNSTDAPIACGIRCNPEYSEVETELYNPAAPGSRLGEVETAFKDGLPDGIEGLHFHTLCESTSYDLEKTLAAFEQRFGHLLPKVKWVNMGGGHLMTKQGYDTAHLVRILKKFKKKWGVAVILEPGSAIAWETGVLVSTVLDIHESRGIKTAITDISFTGHMPDTLEMPYRPRITGTSDPVPGKPTYRIGGVSCLAGDYMQEYLFDKELQVGDRLIFEDMMHYTMVKTTTFNGVRHPDICILRENGELEVVKRFGYEDYRDRLS
ncbi:MAG: carboxynorspermidine decarboxylase [Bacteroidetes bacterium]|nr:carboxynorspermidine decarboxylase [Bacteroidota bacterium]